MNSRVSLTTLDEDILLVIVGLIHSESNQYLRPFSRASRFCKRLSDPLLYRSLVLSDDLVRVNSSRYILQKLREPTNDIRHHIRHLKISNKKRDGQCQGIFENSSDEGCLDLLGEALRSLTHLKSFSWDVNRDIPASIISQLEQQWPQLELSVDIHNRLKETDARLLSSPLLHSLDFGIKYMEQQYSKLPDLRAVVVNASALRKLEIRFTSDWGLENLAWYEKTTNPHVLNLPLTLSDRLPHLQELIFSDDPNLYEFDRKQCQLFCQCMDWSHLRRLGLGISCPQHLFEEIGSHLHSLRSLEMGMRIGDRRYKHWQQGPSTCDHFGPIIDFIESIPSLLELKLTDFIPIANVVAPVVVSCHRALRSLSYHASMNRRQIERAPMSAWTVAQLQELREQCCDLIDLEIDFPLAAGKWPDDYADIITNFNRLHHLKVFVNLDRYASDFGKGYEPNIRGKLTLPDFNPDLAREVAVDLFKRFFQKDPYAWLRSLEVCFTQQVVGNRSGAMEPEYLVSIQRLERDDAPSPLYGGFTMTADDWWMC